MMAHSRSTLFPHIAELSNFATFSACGDTVSAVFFLQFESAPIAVARRWPLFQKVAESIHICHDTNVTGRTKTLHLGRIEVPDVPRAGDVGLPIRSSVQDRIIRRIGQTERPDDQRLNHVGRISQVPSEARRLARCDLIARLQSRIQKNTLDLVKNEPRQD